MSGFAAGYAEVLRGGVWPEGVAQAARTLGKDRARTAYTVAADVDKRAREDAHRRLDAIRADVDGGRVVPASTTAEAERLADVVEAPPFPPWSWVQPPRARTGPSIVKMLSVAASFVVVARSLQYWWRESRKPKPAPPQSQTAAPEPEPEPEPAPSKPRGRSALGAFA